MVENIRQCAMMQVTQDAEYQTFHEIIEYPTEKQERLLSTMDREQKLMGEVPEFRETFFVNRFGFRMTGSRRSNLICWRRSR